MAKTKAQIARSKYGSSLQDLSPAEKAAVTRMFNAQNAPAPEVEWEDEDEEEEEDESSDGVTVKFGRPGYNGTKEVMVKDGTTVEAALAQSGFTINKTKEGLVNKATGAVIKYGDLVVDGAIIAILPGIDSSKQ